MRWRSRWDVWPCRTAPPRVRPSEPFRPRSSATRARAWSTASTPSPIHARPPETSVPGPSHCSGKRRSPRPTRWCGGWGPHTPDTMVRRLALRTVAAAGGLDSATAVGAIPDRDDESRRMALRGSGDLSPALRAALGRTGFRDSSVIVRIEAVAAARLGDGPPDCRPIVEGTRDPVPAIALTAVDSLGSGCADSPGAVAVLRRLAAGPVRSGPADHRWQMPAHSLLALARLDPSAAAHLVPSAARSDRWETRVYAARTGALTDSRPVLYGLSRDSDRNVQEAAIAGLAATAGHDADSVYLRALGSSGNQVVLAAATALEGTTTPGALDSLLRAFDRLTAGRPENARDPRLELLKRIGELGTPATTRRLIPALEDYDTAVVQLAAARLTSWKGEAVEIHPHPLPLPPPPLAATFLRHDLRLRVTMAPTSGGGAFTVRLFPAETPATVARVVRLAAAGFYGGKGLQRGEPN